MKFNLAWPQVALTAILFAAVIVSRRWAPEAAPTVDSMVSTLIGAMLMHLLPKKGGEA